MVGFTSRIGRGGDPAVPFASELESLLYTERLNPSVVTEDDRFAVGYTAYPEYPIRVFEGDGFQVCFEGRLYDHAPDEVASTALQVGAAMLDRGDGTVDLGEWLLSVDGEFLVLAWTDDGERVSVLNDALARLPTYYHHDAESAVLSRDLRYVIENVDVEFDRLSAAQCLLFGYSLGERTIVRDVRRLRPATQLTIDRDDDGSVDVTETTHHTFDFDEQPHADRPRERNATELATRFTAACRNRAGDYDVDLISLSGGLDSRSVLAGYHAAGLSPTAATMESPAYVPSSDVEVAEQLATDFGVDWRTFRVDHPSGADLDTLVKTKNGQMGLVTSYILDFFRQLQAEYGTSLAYVTGDGGDKALPDLTPPRTLDEDELVDYVIAANSMTDVETVTALTGVSEADLRASIREHLDTYPEETTDGTYVHLLVYERAVNMLFEGEDRNRHFFWSVAPFYALPFFRYAMNCPPEQKARYKLYRSFIQQFAPSAGERVHPIYGAPVTSSRHALAALVDDVLSRYPQVLETMKPVIRSINDLDTDASVPQTAVEVIRAQAERNEAIDELFDPEGLESFVDEHDDHPTKSVYRVLAITSVVDDLDGGKSRLEAEHSTVFAA